MTLKLIEEAISVIKTYLEENMAAKLDVLDAEYGDFVLDDIRYWYTAELTSVPEYPSIIVLGDFTDVEGEGEGWMKANHQIIIVCLATDADAEKLRKRLYRYVRACVGLLKTARGSDGWAYTIVFSRLEFSPMYGRAGTFVSDARLIIRAGRYETG